MSTPSVTAVIEARMGSSRVPGKMVLPLAGKPLVWHVITRMKACDSFDRVVLSTSEDRRNDVLAAWAEVLGVPCHRGPEDDLLERDLGALEAVGGDVMVLVSGDNPFYHPEFVDPVVARALARDADFVTNTLMGFSAAWSEPRTFPIGTGVHLFRRDALEACRAKPFDADYRDAFAKFFINHPDEFRLGAVHADGGLERFRRPDLRFCLDTLDDWRFLDRIMTGVESSGSPAGLGAVIDYVDANPDVRDINRHVEQRPL